MGGEHARRAERPWVQHGSSPRGRGTPIGPIPRKHIYRVIPAWAGNTGRCRWTVRPVPGHPRVGGEHPRRRARRRRGNGSSPRGRGTPVGARRPVLRRRVIPAWAGNTRSRRPPARSAPGHPRVGGEHICAWRLRAGASGPSGHPRVGGEHLSPLRPVVLTAGSSPRGRGTQIGPAARSSATRVIPAWAGNTLIPSSVRSPHTGHPRVGGEHTVSGSSGKSTSGSSPRGRGTHPIRQRLLEFRRVIPAWAGNTRCCDIVANEVAGHPRVGGEHASGLGSARAAFGSSPRGRGTPSPHRQAYDDYRVIPAWAGNTTTPGQKHGAISGHPRVGGEHAASVDGARLFLGSSPRGRGTRQVSVAQPVGGRVIPAWAGNTYTRSPGPGLQTGHPRVGGEHVVCPRPLLRRVGSSPRGRGTLCTPARRDFSRRVIPAWAGNTFCARPRSLRASGHPRVGGEHLKSYNRIWNRYGSSPRGRGTLGHSDLLLLHQRVIPAWAGNTPPRAAFAD